MLRTGVILSPRSSASSRSAWASTSTDRPHQTERVNQTQPRTRGTAPALPWPAAFPSTSRASRPEATVPRYSTKSHKGDQIRTRTANWVHHDRHERGIHHLEKDEKTPRRVWIEMFSCAALHDPANPRPDPSASQPLSLAALDRLVLEQRKDLVLSWIKAERRRFVSQGRIPASHFDNEVHLVESSTRAGRMFADIILGSFSWSFPAQARCPVSVTRKSSRQHRLTSAPSTVPTLHHRMAPAVPHMLPAALSPACSSSSPQTTPYPPSPSMKHKHISWPRMAKSPPHLVSLFAPSCKTLSHLPTRSHISKPRTTTFFDTHVFLFLAARLRLYTTVLIRHEFLCVLRCLAFGGRSGGGDA